MKHILILLFSIVTLSAFGQAGSLSQSVYRSRVNDSTAAIAANVAPIAAGYAPFFWNNQATTPGWRVWNGTSYDIGFSSGGNFWKNAGTTNVTTPTINGDVTFTGSFVNTVTGNSSGIISGSGNSGVSVDAVAESSRLFASSAGTEIYLSNTGIQASAVGEISLIPTTELHIQTNSAQRLTISNDGSWDLGPTNDPGTSGYVLTSNGAGAAPTWVAPSGGGFVSPTALTDGASISITSTNNTLTTTQSAITFSDGWTGNYSDVSVTFNQTSATWTFPAGALCVVEGTASGDNTAAITGTSGDKIEISIRDINGTNYRVAIKNFGQ